MSGKFKRGNGVPHNNSAPVSPTGSPQRLELSPDMYGGPVYQRGIMTEDEARRIYGPARTLGASEDVRIAMDNQLAESGIYSLLQHTLELGQGIAPQFMGYGALQNIAQNGLVRACIETVADDMTRAWVNLKRVGGEKIDVAPRDGQDDRLVELAQTVGKLNLQTVFHEACELVGYEGGAFVFIDTGITGAALENPLLVNKHSAELKPECPLRFTAIDPVNVFPGDYNSTSPLAPSYFRPRWWWVLGQRVHASRLIRLVANEVPVLLRPTYNFLGIPQAQILWDYVLHFQQCRAAAARLLTKFSLTVFKAQLTDVLYNAAGTAKVDARIRYMVDNMSNDGVLAVDKDTEDVVKIETPISGVTDIVRQSLEFLAALNRTPAVKLLGVSPSGFNATGESDIRNYYDHISSQQEKVLRHGIRTALDCVQLHLYGDIDPSIAFDFAPLGQEDRAALSTYQKTKADTVAVYVDRDIISPEEARNAIASDPDSGFAGLDPEDVPEASNMPTEGMEGEGGLPMMREGDLDDTDKAGVVEDVYTRWKRKAAYDTGDFEEGKRQRDEGGKFTRGAGSVAQTVEKERAVQAKIDAIQIERGKDNVLPGLNADTLKYLGRTDKPVLLKKNIIEKNLEHHPELEWEA